MLKRLRFRWTLSLAVWALVGALQAVAQTSPPQPYVQSVPVGQKPMGVAALGTSRGHVLNDKAAVANAGDNSVSIFLVSRASFNFQLVTLAPITTVQGIPSPFSVSSCES